MDYVNTCAGRVVSTNVVWSLIHLLWSPYGIGQTIIFSSCGFFFYLSSFYFLA